MGAKERLATHALSNSYDETGRRIKARKSYEWTIVPNWICFNKGKHRIYAKVQYNSVEKKIEMEPSAGWCCIAPIDFLFTVKVTVSKQVFC